MIRIRRMTLTLPAGAVTDAAALSRRIGRELARVPVRGEVQTDRLEVGPVEVGAAADDHALGRRLAAAVAARLGGRR